MSVKYIVRHGAMRFLGEFEGGDEGRFNRWVDVVIRTDRGQEVGQVLCEANPRAVELLSEPTKGQIIRLLTAEDRQQAAQQKDKERTEFTACSRCIAARQLQMELVDVEH